MKRYYCCITAVLVAIVFSFCGNRPKGEYIYTGHEAVLVANCSLYKAELEHKLQQLEKETAEKPKVKPMRFSHDNFNVE